MFRTSGGFEGRVVKPSPFFLCPPERLRIGNGASAQLGDDLALTLEIVDAPQLSAAGYERRKPALGLDPFLHVYISGSGVRSPFSENIPMFTAWCLLVVT